MIVGLISFSTVAFSNQDSSVIVNDSITVEMLESYAHFTDSVNASFQYQYGIVELNDGVASIKVPEGFKYLDEEQSRKVLVDLWGNPPSPCSGMLFPEESGPMDNLSFAIEISYSEEGYIDDEDAEDIDYEELLEEMQKDTKEANKFRIQQGYPQVDFVGWASAPYYDHDQKKLHWAKELKFEDTEVNTLNYNIRILGRKGVLVLNAISDIDQLEEVQNSVVPILSAVNFNDGYKYDEFNPDIDEVAAYGIGGLIAGKVLAKAGVFVLLAKFWKVIGIAVIGGFAALKKMFKKKEA